MSMRSSNAPIGDAPERPYQVPAGRKGNSLPQIREPETPDRMLLGGVGSDALNMRLGQVALDVGTLLGGFGQEVNMHLIGAELGALMAEMGEVESCGIVAGSLSVPNRLLLPTSVITTQATQPIRRRGAITCTACKYGVRPTSCPGRLPGFSSSTSTVRPANDALKACQRRLISACSRCNRSDFSSAGDVAGGAICA